MGQGNSEGNAPEDTTPDAPREQAGDAAPVSPNSPTPTEADTATRQSPVVQDAAEADAEVDDAVEPEVDDAAEPEADDAAEPEADDAIEPDGVVAPEPGVTGTEPDGAASDPTEPADTEPDDAASDVTEPADTEPDVGEGAAPGAEPPVSGGEQDATPAADAEPTAEDAGPTAADAGSVGEPAEDDGEAGAEPVVDGAEAARAEPRPSVGGSSADEQVAPADVAVSEPGTDEPGTAELGTDEPGTAEPGTDGASPAVPAPDDTRTRSTPVDPAGDPRARAAATLAAAAAAAAAEVDARSASGTASPISADDQVTPGSTGRPSTQAAAAAETAATPASNVAAETAATRASTGAAKTVATPASTGAAETVATPASTGAAETVVMPASTDAAETAATPASTGAAKTAATPVTAATPTAAATPAAAPATSEEGSPLDVFESEPTRNRRWWRPVLIVAGVLVVLGGAYVGGAYALADRVPRGTTVAGIEVGGMSAADARTALTDGLAERSSQPITVTAREVSGSLDPATAGLSFDVDATVDALTGIDLRPQRMWQHLAGGGEEQPVTAVDEQALDAAVQDLSGVLMLDPVDGSVVFVDGAPQGVAAVDGWSLDAEGARSTLEDGWLTEALPIELPSDTVSPTITQDEVDRVVRDVASAVVSGPVTVSVADQSAELPVDVLVGAASFVPQESELALQMDGTSLVDQVVTRTSDLLTTAADATFQFQDGAPVIVPGTPGTTLDPAALGTAVATAAENTSERTAAVELVESDPAQSTEALQALGVTSAISEFSTPLTSEPKRTQNITAGAAAINGTLIRPGETFSLTEALGPIDAAHGFVQAGAIVNGEHSDAWGGGLSQLSTTTFNAAFEAGMEDVEHTPHSEWFTRYPAGREATLYTGSIDMKWKNTTPYGVLVQAYVADGKTWVRLWSTPYYEVSISSGAKTNVVSPTTVYNTSPTCSASSAGNPGFSISVTRTVSLNGEVQGTDNLSWRYKAQNKVVCGADPATAAPAG